MRCTSCIDRRREVVQIWKLDPVSRLLSHVVGQRAVVEWSQGGGRQTLLHTLERQLRRYQPVVHHRDRLHADAGFRKGRQSLQQTRSLAGRSLLDDTLYFTALAGAVVDTYGNPTNQLWVLEPVATVPPSTVVGRKLFYNQSKFDGNNAAVTAADDAAIATDKSPYIPGSGAATFANVSSYTKGINGIMIDISGPHGPITAADFKFRVGNNNTPGSWNAPVPTPTTVTTRAGAGIGGSDRVEILWANGAIQKQWLEVIVKGNDALGGNNLNTGLAASDVLFWGSAPGDMGAGNSATRALVNATDELAVRANQLFTGATVTNLYDIDRTGNVGATEQLFIRANGTIVANATWFINVAGAGPFAPEGDPDAVPAPAAVAVIDGGDTADARDDGPGK